MDLKKILTDNHSALVEEWALAAFQSYAPETIKLLKRKSDCFQNPVGSTILDGLDKCFRELTADFRTDEMISHLEKIIRIRSVQEMPASEAVAFIFRLKGIIRNVIPNDVRAELPDRQLEEIDNRIDRLGLLAFDAYMTSRNRLYEIRLEQIRNGSIKTVDRLNRRLGSGFENNHPGANNDIINIEE